MLLLLSLACILPSVTTIVITVKPSPEWLLSSLPYSYEHNYQGLLTTSIIAIAALRALHIFQVFRAPSPGINGLVQGKMLQGKSTFFSGEKNNLQEQSPYFIGKSMFFSGNIGTSSFFTGRPILFPPRLARNFVTRVLRISGAGNGGGRHTLARWHQQLHRRKISWG